MAPCFAPSLHARNQRPAEIRDDGHQPEHGNAEHEARENLTFRFGDVDPLCLYHMRMARSVRPTRTARKEMVNVLLMSVSLSWGLRHIALQ